MKKSILLAILAVGFWGCGSDEPEPTSNRRAASRPAKAPPSVQSQKAEDFRAIERPSTYSDE
jgi:hypothetical protein